MSSIPNASNLGTFVITIIICISILGIILNILLLILLKRFKQNNSYGFQLIKVIAIVDLIASFNYIATFTRRIIYGAEALDSPVFCPGLQLVWIILTGESGIMVSSLALERYLLVCHGFSLPARKSWLVIILFSIIIMIPHIGNTFTGNFIHDPTDTYCMPFGSTWATAALYTTRFILLAPYLLISFSYLNIIYHSSHQRGKGSYLVWIRAMAFMMTYTLAYLPSLIFYIWKLTITSPPPNFYFALLPISISLMTVFNPGMALALHHPLQKKLGDLINNPSSSQSSSS